MQDTLLGIVDDFKVFVMAGIQTLPLTMAGTLLILGFGTANYAMLFFLVGMLFVVPIIPWFLNLILPESYGTDSPGCGIVPGPAKFVIPQWNAMVFFFLGYMMTNAIKLYQMPPTEPDDPQKTSLRKSQCIMGMIAVLVSIVALLAIRLLTCNNAVWSCVAAVYGMGMGIGWYYLLNTSASGRLADLFGIANRLLSPSAFVNEPVGCVPIA